MHQDEKQNKQRTQSSFQLRESVTSRKSLKKSFKKKQEAQELANIVLRMDSEASDQEDAQFSKEIEVQVEKPEEQ